MYEENNIMNEEKYGTLAHGLRHQAGATDQVSLVLFSNTAATAFERQPNSPDIITNFVRPGSNSTCVTYICINNRSSFYYLLIIF